MTLEHAPGFLASHVATMREVLGEVTPQASTIRVFGRAYDVPRLTSWHGDPGRSYTFGGKTLAPRAWTPALARLRDRLSEREGVGFNSVLVNLYRDGSDSVAMHADDEPELGPSDRDVRIASLSLGCRRRFAVKGPQGRRTWDLGEGDLFVMRGRLQSTHTHGVPKTRRKVGPRLNLTFRVIR